MSLHINGLIRKIPQIIFGLAALLIIGCLVKVTIWESIYYGEKDGSTRNPVVEVGQVNAPDQEEVEVDETDVTPEQVISHTVAADKPRYIMASFMGQDTKARVREVGLTTSGAMGTLASIFDVAWYRNSAKPGQGGTILMNGHNGGPTKIGIFKYLDQAKIGDIITIERGDGLIFKYRVAESKVLPLAEANAYMATMQQSPEPGVESLSLISCAGEWSQQQKTYLSRSMVRAVLVQ